MNLLSNQDIELIYFLRINGFKPTDKVELLECVKNLDKEPLVKDRILLYGSSYNNLVDLYENKDMDEIRIILANI